LEKTNEELSGKVDSLEMELGLSNEYEGTILSTDTKYIAFEDSLKNISLSEEQYSNALNDLMTKGKINIDHYRQVTATDEDENTSANSVTANSSTANKNTSANSSTTNKNNSSKVQK
jgi:hypothetical protein